MSTTERIRIQVTQDGAKAVRRDIEGLGAGAEKASGAMSMLGTAIKAAVAGAAVRETIRLADSYTDLTNKIRFATRSEQEMVSVRSELFKVDNQNRSSVETTADVYSKLRMSTQSLGLSQREVIELTDTLQKATVLSGASAENAANSLRQLGQGMAAGALRGDELNSVMENTPYIAKVIAESMGKTVGEVRALGAEGKITGEIIANTFKGARQSIVENFGKRVPTVTESLSVAGNVVMRLVGEMNDATGASAGLAKMIIEISNSVNDMIPQIVELGSELANLSEFKGAFNDIFSADSMPDTITTLQFVTLMISTMEDRLIGAMRAFHKLGQMMHGQKTDGSLFDDLGDVLTGQGDVTGRVLNRIDAQRNQRRGSTTLNAEAGDPGNTLDLKGRNTTKPAAEKGPTAATVLADLQRENELLRMGNEERRIETELDRIRDQLKGKLSKQAEANIRYQLEENRVIEVANEALEEQLKLEVQQIEKEQDIQKRFSDRMTGLREERMLMSLSAREREIQIQLLEAQHDAEGSLTRVQLKSLEVELRRNQVLVERAKALEDARDEMPRDFGGAMTFLGDEYLKNVRTIGQELAVIFGPGGALQQGLHGVVGSLSDVIGQSIAFGDSWNDTQEAIKNVGRSIVAEIISSLIRIPIQLAINEAIASGLRAKATAETVAQAGVVTTAMAPAAAATSLATGGTNSAGATAAIVGVAALAAGALIGAAAFEDGGYTGNGGRSQIAGLVHGQEYVLNADATRRYRAEAEAMNSGTYSPGGGGGDVQVTIVNQAPGVEFETRKVDDRHIEVIARRVVQEMAPDVIARDMKDPQSRTGRALSQTGSYKRVRT